MYQVRYCQTFPGISSLTVYEKLFTWSIDDNFATRLYISFHFTIKVSVEILLRPFVPSSTSAFKIAAVSTSQGNLHHLQSDHMLQFCDNERFNKSSISIIPAGRRSKCFLISSELVSLNALPAQRYQLKRIQDVQHQ